MYLTKQLKCLANTTLLKIGHKFDAVRVVILALPYTENLSQNLMWQV